MIRDYFRLALRNIRRRRLRSWLTLIGIIIGITSVVALVGLGQGLEVAISKQFGMLGTDMVTVTAEGGFGPPGYGVQNPLNMRNLEEIRKIKGIDKVGARLIKTGKLEYNDKVLFGYAASLPEDEGRELFLEVTGIEAQEGRLLKKSERGKITVGSNLATADVGEYFGKMLVPGSKVRIQDNMFEVVGVLEQQGSLIFDNIVLMNEADMRETFDIPDDDYDIIVAKTIKAEDVPSVKADIEKYLRKDRDIKPGEEDFSVETQESALEQISSVLFGVQMFVYVIAGISIVVGGFGIMNTMFTSVIERTREIGIMKSIGARNSNIFLIFFIESGMIGAVGGLIGILMGSMLSLGLASAGAAALNSPLIQAHLSIWLLIGSFMGSFLLGSLFGIIPAVKASKLHPVDALRHK
jgi:putative ABC transport system permease protein